jgi:hypothetical protein
VKRDQDKIRFTYQLENVPADNLVHRKIKRDSGKQAGRYTDRQQTAKQTGRYTDRQKHEETAREADWKIDRQAEI